jgi:hypothetical protein
MQVTVEIPDEFAGYIVPAGSDPARLLLENCIASAYRWGRLTVEQVAATLGFTMPLEIDAFLKKHNIGDRAITGTR